jgi:hypothetical protein
MVRTQISFDESLYARARELAARQGISLSELCRRGVTELIARSPSDEPWMAFAGIVQGEGSDSASVDHVVYSREQP